MFNPRTVRAEMARRGVTIEELSRRAGVATSTISNVLAPDGNPRARTLAGIARALGVDVGLFFDPEPQNTANRTPAA